jgi:hypothetical protein
MREKKTISGEELLKRDTRLNVRADEKTRTTRMRRRLQLRNALTEYGKRDNSFWLQRSRNMNNVARNSHESSS